MGAFSNLDVALSEMKYGRGAETVRIGSIGVCLDDTGQPVRLYIVDTIYACGSIDVFACDKTAPDYDTPRMLHMSDFWALT
jgi:hypothetical protein